VAAKKDAGEWAGFVRGFAEKRGARYEPVGGLNPRGGPAALCPGGTNRVTGELAEGFWGASCDADEQTEGGRLFGGGAVLPRALLAKAHMPDLATVVPIFHVESIERTAEDLVDRRSRRRVEFESLDFNRRFIATVPADHDPIALRELFSPAFLDWTTRIPGEVDFGITDRQLFLFWRLRELTADELEAALKAAGGLFTRLHREMDENDIAHYDPGPWNAGLEPFPTTAA
jgi:hypothetical protein